MTELPSAATSGPKYGWISCHGRGNSGSMTPDVDADMLHHYQVRTDESQRLYRSRHGRLELIRTKELLRRHLPRKPSTIADIGGGTGIHAEWLGKEGHRVLLIDPIRKHVETAANLPGVTATVGDARSLPWPDDSVDASLVLGPLYHLVDAVDRRRALQEAVRVTRPGGLIASAAISRYLPLLEAGGLGVLDKKDVEECVDLIKTGRHAGDAGGFPASHFHLAAELENEVMSAGLERVVVFGVEGPLVAALDNAEPGRAQDVLESAARCAAAVERDMQVINLSSHLLAIAFAPAAADAS